MAKPKRLIDFKTVFTGAIAITAALIGAYATLNAGKMETNAPKDHSADHTVGNPSFGDLKAPRPIPRPEMSAIVRWGKSPQVMTLDGRVDAEGPFTYPVTWDLEGGRFEGVSGSVIRKGGGAQAKQIVSFSRDETGAIVLTPLKPLKPGIYLVTITLRFTPDAAHRQHTVYRSITEDLCTNRQYSSKLVMHEIGRELVDSNRLFSDPIDFIYTADGPQSYSFPLIDELQKNWLCGLFIKREEGVSFSFSVNGITCNFDPRTNGEITASVQMGSDRKRVLLRKYGNDHPSFLWNVVQNMDFAFLFLTVENEDGLRLLVAGVYTESGPQSLGRFILPKAWKENSDREIGFFSDKKILFGGFTEGTYYTKWSEKPHS